MSKFQYVISAMLCNEEITLSEEGRKIVDPDYHDDEWYIKSLNHESEITIISEFHQEYSGLDLDVIEWDPPSLDAQLMTIVGLCEDADNLLDDLRNDVDLDLDDETIIEEIRSTVGQFGIDLEETVKTNKQLLVWLTNQTST